MSYAKRAGAERKLKKQPLPLPHRLLSTNQKTGSSLNLPILNCRPTRRCADACYACEGPISFPNSTRKALMLDALLREGKTEMLILEAGMLQDVRINGSGDLCIEHLPAVLGIAEACPKTVFWGFTRKLEVAREVNCRFANLSLILSFDPTSRQAELDDYGGPLAYGPRRPGDDVPDDHRIVVVFPEHRGGRTQIDVPAHPKDCPATRGERIMACQRCRRCWHPYDHIEEELA